MLAAALPLDRRPAIVNARASARAAGLVHVDDRDVGLRRVACGRGFRYVDARDHAVRDRRVLARIAALAIPPAWRDVWICADPNGHIQATGRDARGRKQYRYHADWRRVRDATKFDRMLAFARALPSLRRTITRALRRHGLGRARVIATVVRLLDVTLVRVGNEEYARANHSYGLTTLRDRHVDVHGRRLRFVFRGKSGQPRVVSLGDEQLARIVHRCRELPGHLLFQYVDDEGAPVPVTSTDVNDFIFAATGAPFTAKDFRTWHGTVAALAALRACGPARTQARRKRDVIAAVDAVAAQLGNTRAVCRKSYIHPAILDRYLDGTLGERDAPIAMARRGLSAEEAACLRFLRGTRARARH